MIIEYEIDCWKCSDMHYGVASSDKEFWAIVNNSGDWQHTIRILSTEPRRIRVNHNKTMVLIPWTKNRGIVFGITGIGFQVLPWLTARWEFADYGGTNPEWDSQVLRGPRV